MTMMGEDTTTKWDGMRNRKLVPIAVYYLMIEWNDIDGAVL